MAVKRWNGAAWETYAGSETSYGFEATDSRVGRKTWVGANTPNNPSDGDIWIDQDTTTNSVAASAFDAKGDLLVGTGADVFAKQSVGVNGQVLVADSTQSTGVKWDYANAREGLTLVVPTSVTVGSGSGSVATNGAVTFSGASSVGVNNCFTSTYDSYQIEYNFTLNASGNVSVAVACVTGGTQNASNWGYNNWLVYSNGLSGSQYNQGTSAYLLVSDVSGTNTHSSSLLMTNPALTKNTFAHGNSISLGSGRGNHDSWFINGILNNTTSYDGIKLYFIGTGTMTGTIRIYGYNNGA